MLKADDPIPGCPSPGGGDSFRYSFSPGDAGYDCFNCSYDDDDEDNSDDPLSIRVDQIYSILDEEPLDSSTVNSNNASKDFLNIISPGNGNAEVPGNGKDTGGPQSLENVFSSHWIPRDYLNTLDCEEGTLPGQAFVGSETYGNYTGGPTVALDCGNYYNTSVNNAFGCQAHCAPPHWLRLSSTDHRIRDTAWATDVFSSTKSDHQQVNAITNCSTELNGFVIEEPVHFSNYTGSANEIGMRDGEQEVQVDGESSIKLEFGPAEGTVLPSPSMYVPENGVTGPDLSLMSKHNSFYGCNGSFNREEIQGSLNLGGNFSMAPLDAPVYSDMHHVKTSNNYDADTLLQTSNNHDTNIGSTGDQYNGPYFEGTAAHILANQYTHPFASSSSETTFYSDDERDGEPSNVKNLEKQVAQENAFDIPLLEMPTTATLHDTNCYQDVNFMHQFSIEHPSVLNNGSSFFL